MSEPVVYTRGLERVFRTPKRAPGLAGAFKALVSRETTDKVAVSELDIEIQAGEFVGFLGPNGAGKTTTIKMLTGILQPTAGESKVLGYEPFRRDPRMLSRIALVMGNRQQLWWDLPARESFIVLREIYDVPHDKWQERLDRLVEALGLNEYIDRQVRKLSLGERMKCELVAALLHGPDVVFLDEPTIGLDVVSQVRIREFLKDFNEKEGCTVLLTSHYMQDVETLCPRVVVINHGKKAFDGPLEQLKKEFAQTQRLQITFQDEPQLPAGLEPKEQHGLRYEFEIPTEQIPQLTAQLLQSGNVVEMSLEETDIEDVIRRVFTDGTGDPELPR